MTTRRGFIQGMLVAIGAAVMPKVAEARPINEPDVELEHGIAIDGRDSFSRPGTLFGHPVVYSSIVPGDEVYLLPLCSIDEYLAFLERDRQRDLDFIHGTGSGKPLGCIGWEPNSDGDWFGMCGLKPEWHDEEEEWCEAVITQAPAERSKLLQDDKPTTFTSPFASPLEVPGSGKREVPDQH